ncbi:RSP [Phlyctema vagabunda]|uniref:RSP n=1 Tax=Phlyctema vagabunda TaxID=108571 RepID=A0ABR4PNB7_9HELO
MMIRDVASAHRTLPQWDSYQRGLEALGASLASINNQISSSKKALTVGDLLVKPIQRVCKYPLLFAELLKQTPVFDCPESHAEIESVLVRLREATAEINRATEDPRMKGIMEKSWLLQDRLVFPSQPAFVSMNNVRALGHVHLCGVLHGSWQTKDGVDGQYLICLLYRDFLLLASSVKSEQAYAIQACIGTNQIRLEEIDNGRGIQCHTAPYSWKLVFEFDHQLFELTMSACSPKEELEWRSRLSDGASKATLDSGEQSLFTSLTLGIKPLGTVFGKPGTVARRISIHRATTVGPTSGLCQVIIKNTNAFKDVPQNMSSVSINRSQSLLTTKRVPVLSPSRAERIRLENLISDVWTRDILPFPGMSGRARSEHPVRASASSIMRKLSVASIASNFTKRSGSLASVHHTTDDLPGLDSSTNVSDATVVEEPPRNSTIYPESDGRRARSETWAEEEKSHCTERWPTHDYYDSRDQPVGTMKRLATLRIHKGWAHDGRRIITPPLRTSSANSITYHKPSTAPLVADVIMGEKENDSRVHPMQLPGKKSRGFSRARGFGADGIWSFFR